VAKLKDKIQNALDENRMMVLGVQVLIGFDFRAVFEKGFTQLPRAAQLMTLASLTVLCVTLALLLTPGAHHRISERGEDSPEFHRFTTWCASLALFPFAVALALDVGVAGWHSVSPTVGGILGAATGFIALGMWYGIEVIARQTTEGRQAMRSEGDHEKAKLTDKIRHVLTEARVVLPGVQALLGFQFAAMLVEGFDKLPTPLKYLHLGSLACLALSIIFLMTPAAWHRLVERGEETEAFHTFASRMVIAALPPIALGICGDFYIVSWKVTQSVPLAAGMTATLGLLFFGLWFGLSLVRRPRVAGRHGMVARPA
jgi:hypothetical protein